MAKDHFAYVIAYRKYIDEIEQYKKETWNIVMDSKTTPETKIKHLKNYIGYQKRILSLI